MDALLGAVGQRTACEDEVDGYLTTGRLPGCGRGRIRDGTTLYVAGGLLAQR